MTRETAIKGLKAFRKEFSGYEPNEEMFDMAIKALEQEPTSFQWCDTCKEYDQEKHCCHRWSKVIRDTVEEMKQEQEPILDKIRAEILEEHENAYAREDNDTAYGLSIALDILDKYKAESEEE